MPILPGAVIYARVSTGEQVKHGTSLESQVETCRDKALSLGLPIYAEYQDAGISGGLLVMRDGIQQAISDIQSGRADTLICANLSRFSRDAEHQQTLKKAIEAAGGRIVFCDMVFDQTPEGDLAYGLMGQFAQYERQVIRARTMRGKRKRAEEGQQPQRSRPPYGYHIVTNAQVAANLYPVAMRGQYLISEPTAAIVRRLFADYHSGGFSLSTLCLALNREGVATPANGRAWREATLRVILMNPVYKGQPVSGRQKCATDETRLGQRHKLTGRPIVTPHTRTLAPEENRLTLSAPALVTEAVWDAVQERLARGPPRGAATRARCRCFQAIRSAPSAAARRVSSSRRRTESVTATSSVTATKTPGINSASLPAEATCTPWRLWRRQFCNPCAMPGKTRKRSPTR